MISDEHRCIFVHIPKNAGASIEKIIWPKEDDRTEENLWLGYKYADHNQYQTGALQHLFASNIRTAVGGKRFEEYFKFSFVRNPWDKAISQYLYLQKRRGIIQDRSLRSELTTRANTIQRSGCVEEKKN